MISTYYPILKKTIPLLFLFLHLWSLWWELFRNNYQYRSSSLSRLKNEIAVDCGNRAIILSELVVRIIINIYYKTTCRYLHVLMLQDVMYLQQLRIIRIIKWQASVYDSVKHHSHAPYITILRPVRYPLQDLRRRVRVATAKRFGKWKDAIFRLHMAAGETEIRQFYVEAVVHEQIFAFYVPANKKTDQFCP